MTSKGHGGGSPLFLPEFSTIIQSYPPSTADGPLINLGPTMRSRISSAFGLALATSLSILGDAGRADELRYNREVRPILAESCFRCHGPGTKKAGLRLDRSEAAYKKTESGEIPVVPGKADESEMIRRILSDDPNEVMPPPAAKKPLKPEEKELLKRWVQEGAKYEAHWSFQSPVKEPLPKVEGPGYSVNNPVDAFIADRLKHSGLKMNPEADRPTLIRRVAFTLIGLPPTPLEVETFVGDTSPKAYEAMVERYLNSPRYGEEMARHWLDAARYADTHGLHLDNERQIWPYRDWVVKAFNENLPFDQFTIEQLAGDLLPNATLDQKVATGFNRCNVTTSEGGSIEDELVFRYAVDRASTTAETWMGLTAGCAVCHDHKFDPISAEEFYSFYSFFYSIAGSGLDGNALLHEPTVKLSTPEQLAKLAELANKIAAAQKDLDDTLKNLPAKAIEPEPATEDVKLSFKAWLKAQQATPDKDFPGNLKGFVDAAKQGKLDAEGETALKNHYATNVCEGTKSLIPPKVAEVARLNKERADLDASIPSSYVFREADKPRDSFLMTRGQYDKPGKKVEPATPAFLPPLKKADPKGRATRLDMAKWLVSPEHPLTSRVAVNQFWQQVFGVGLVATSIDFGTQGEPPSHPELLDWLALKYRESGWDTRALVRLLVNSAAFRQSSRVTPEMLKLDPSNRLLSRGPRLRLDAEQIRDNALFLSGLLSLKMGGRGVKPYQPVNIWEPVAFSGSNTGSYQQDHSAALYRRSIYTFLKRTAPPPFMSNFDAPNRESFCARRERSNTPLQALQLMNDTQHFEAARAFAERVVREGGPTPAERIPFAFSMILSRAPEPDELAVLQAEFQSHLTRFNSDPASAGKLIRVGESPVRATIPEPELAAYTMLANALFNLDETVTRN